MGGMKQLNAWWQTENTCTIGGTCSIRFVDTWSHDQAVRFRHTLDNCHQPCLGCDTARGDAVHPAAPLGYVLTVIAGMLALLLVLTVWPIIGTAWLSAFVGVAVVLSYVVQRFQRKTAGKRPGEGRRR